MTFVELAITVIIAVVGSNGLWSYIQHKSTKKSASERMIVALGADRLQYLLERYILRDGITTMELANVRSMYVPYVEMGGNGHIKALMEKADELPIITAEEAESIDRTIRNGQAKVEVSTLDKIYKEVN